MEKALSIHETHFSKTHAGVARTLLCLGNAYQASGNLARARETLEKSLEVHLRHFSEKHLRLAPVYLSLGLVHQALGHYGEAREFLTKSLDIYEQTEGNHPIEKARVLRSLGDGELREGNLESCEPLYCQSLGIAQHNNHPDLFKTWEALADFHLQKLSRAEDSPLQRKERKKQAIACLDQALQVIKTRLSNNAYHRARIQGKAMKIEKS